METGTDKRAGMVKVEGSSTADPVAVRPAPEYLRQYADALRKDTVALMSGIGSVALAFWAAYFPPTRPEGTTLLWILVFISMLVASFRVWRNAVDKGNNRVALLNEQLLEREAELDQVQKRLESEQDKNLRAELVGEIQDYAINGNYPEAGRFRKLQIILKVSFLNIRQVPAPIKNFSLIAHLNDVMYVAQFAQEGTLCQRTPNLREYEKVENLAFRIGSTATQGKAFDGYLEFVLPRVEASNDGSTSRLTLVVLDGIGGRHEINFQDITLRPSQWGIAGRVFRCDEEK